MLKRINCNCQKSAGCKLCQGTGQYDYELGPAGWQPFRCPNCSGARNIEDPTAPDNKKVCATCKGEGIIDPANPPATGFWDKLSKILFGA